MHGQLMFLKGRIHDATVAVIMVFLATVAATGAATIAAMVKHETSTIATFDIYIYINYFVQFPVFS